ncbi:hypothetical protein L0F63_004232, partial [Massospora cicadina]
AFYNPTDHLNALGSDDKDQIFLRIWSGITRREVPQSEVLRQRAGFCGASQLINSDKSHCA